MLSHIGKICLALVVGSLVFAPIHADSLLGKAKTKSQSSPYNKKKRDRKTYDYQVGDTVIMNISIKDTWEFTRKFDTKRDMSWAAKFKSFITHFGGATKKSPPDVQFEASNEKKTDGKSREESKVRFKIPAEVIEIMPNGDLVLDAARNVNLSQDAALVRVGGRVNPKYIKEDMVDSDNILQLHVKTIGDGPLNDNRKRGFIIKFLEQFRPF